MPRAVIRDFRTRYGPWALVAGASQGLGAAYAQRLAALGLHLVLVARRQPQLDAVAERLDATHGIATRTIALDLSRADSATLIDDATRDLDVGLLVYNTGRSVIGPFLERPLEDHLDELAVNTRGPLSFAYTLGRRMVARGRGASC